MEKKLIKILFFLFICSIEQNGHTYNSNKILRKLVSHRIKWPVNSLDNHNINIANSAGYIGTCKKKDLIISSARSTWVVPTSTLKSDLMVGTCLEENAKEIFDDTNYAFAGTLNTKDENEKEICFAFVMISPKEFMEIKDLNVRPGNLFSAVIRYSPNEKKVTFKLVNGTTGVSKKIVYQLSSGFKFKPVAADFIAELLTDSTQEDPGFFKQINFKSSFLTFNGARHSTKSSEVHAIKVQMENIKGKIIAEPSDLDDNGGFVITQKNIK